MATMITNSEAIRKLRDDLLDTVDGLREQLKKTESAMDEVAQDWKDMQFRKYNEEFTKDKELIPPLCDDIEAFEDEVLRRLYEIAKRYEEL
jgi:uncharacterized protein YukE